MKVHWIHPTCIPTTRLGNQLWTWFCQLKDHGKFRFQVPVIFRLNSHGHSLRRRANARNFNSSLWPIYIINLVDKTKLAYYTSPPTQCNSFVKNLAAFTAFKLVENKFCFISVYLSIYLSICWLDSFKILFYSMIPSLDDVKFCRKRQQLEKKLVQLLKIMV